MKKYSSITAEVKDIIMEVVSDGMEHSRQELLGIVKSKMENPEELREGIYTGGIKILVSNGSLITVGRGTYRLNLSASKDMELKKKVSLILENCKEQLCKCCIGVSLLGINEEAVWLASEINDVVAYLNDVGSRLEEPEPEEVKPEPEEVKVGLEELEELKEVKVEPEEVIETQEEISEAVFKKKRYNKEKKAIL